MIHTRQREADRPGGFRSGQKPQRIFTAVITYKNYIILNNNSSRTRKQARLFFPLQDKEHPTDHHWRLLCAQRRQKSAWIAATSQPQVIYWSFIR
jgi:hypothetical protein